MQTPVRVAGMDRLGHWEEECHTIDFAPDGCGVVMQRRVEVGNVLTLWLTLPTRFQLVHAHYPKPDANGCRRFQAAVRNVSRTNGGVRVGVQFLTDVAPAPRIGRLRPAVFLALAAALLALVCWGISRSHAENRAAPGMASAGAQPAMQMPVARTFSGQMGPWGELEYTRILIEPPDRHVENLLAITESPSARWVWQGATRAEVRDVLREAGLSPTQIEHLLGQHAEVTADAVIVAPPDDVILGLPERAREIIYRSLARSEGNRWQDWPLVYYPEFVNEQLELGGFTAEVETSFRRLLYHRGKWLLFSDPGTLLRQLPNRQSKLRLVSTLHRKITYIARLKIDRHTNLDAVEGYWQFEQRQHDLRPLLESLARIPGGASLDIVHLLPPFARHRLYRYPEPEEAALDCHYSSLNFFNDPPDARLRDTTYQAEVLLNQYEEVTQPRFGDVITLGAPEGTDDGKVTLVHSGVYLADNLVFTKNGKSPAQPWIVMKLDTMIDKYQTVRAAQIPLKLSFYRKRQQL